jgi:hypothetical protein
MNSDATFIVIFAIVINWIIIYLIIASASKSSKIYLESVKQTLILSKLAKQQGVEETTVNNIVKIATHDQLLKFTAKKKTELVSN